MRPPRVVALVFVAAVSILFLCRAISSAASRPHVAAAKISSSPSKTSLSFNYFNTPFSLFPPNAAISLTDDNSTSFAARPAAFGPKLAANGLSGQLWVGSGFAEDSLDGNGELGCSDLPGWGSGNTRAVLRSPHRTGASRTLAVQGKSSLPKQGGPLLNPDQRQVDPSERSQPDILPDKHDNTDNHLNENRHRPLARRDALSPSPASLSSSHADIQSLQEAAEIRGKVVLLMRGSCGFLEKVMWAQRRGAIAVIVGDNQKGGPLIQMFAHGDEVENVTVPSVFTARTTAHLLSSLTQPGSFVRDSLDDDYSSPGLKPQQVSKLAGKVKAKRSSAPRFAGSNSATASPRPVAACMAKQGLEKRSAKKSGWFFGLFRRAQPTQLGDGGSRPPTSGRLDWVLVAEWSDEKDRLINEGMRKSRKSKSKQDNFIVGVQDWRDPDLLPLPDDALPGEQASKGGASDKLDPAPKSREGSEDALLDDPSTNGPKGGSITPGSGEYNAGKALTKDGKYVDAADSASPARGQGLMSKIFGDDEGEAEATSRSSAQADHPGLDASTLGNHLSRSELHEGLWVTITPTSSASPFFDTLLVLVVSPLVTLTVVYTLLIIRGRIRRRRWRAPKSVVDRLPVRTFHTVASTPSSPTSSPRLASPATPTSTTPLLQQQGWRRQPRPRSRTTTGVFESQTMPTASPIAAPPGASDRDGNSHPEHEKGAAGFSLEWRRYMGRQVECVVCLEEYVDGVSRVMSLPCGHEFHADCITPWLTTRRRTCPICKGDVVRLLAHENGSYSGSRFEPYHNDSDEDVEAEAAEASGSHPMDGTRAHDDHDGHERDLDSPGPADRHRAGGPPPPQHDGWFSLLASSLTSRAGLRSPSPRSPHRDR